MNRRELLKALSATGILLGAGIPISAARAARANQYYIFVSASGGWDVTSICDPKGDVLYSESRGVINHYPVSAIRQVGNIRYAPAINPNYAGVDWLDDFMRRHYSDLRVYNGINFGTNSHSLGTAMSTSGKHSSLQPVAPAFLAAPYGKDMPMPFYLGGGHGETGGLVGASRLTDVGMIQRLTESNPYLPDHVMAEIDWHHKQQMDELEYDMNSEAERNALLEFMHAHANKGEMARLADRLPASPSSGNKGRAEIAAAALAAGVTATVSLSSGGFDTHSNHDVNQNNAIMNYFELVSHLINELERQGIASQTMIVMSSDFSRTPWFNSGNGKDHWMTGSMMVWSRELNGNRVIGATDGQIKPVKLNKETLMPDSGGIELTPTHLHLALRERAGMLGSSYDRAYPLFGEVLDLLS